MSTPLHFIKAVVVIRCDSETRDIGGLMSRRGDICVNFGFDVGLAVDSSFIVVAI